MKLKDSLLCTEYTCNEVFSLSKRTSGCPKCGSPGVSLSRLIDYKEENEIFNTPCIRLDRHPTPSTTTK